MQTFLPYPSFELSAQALDYRRLGKQRVEALQILNAIYYKTRWINHPATKMWVGFEDALTLYKNVCIKEWVRRGYKNTMKIDVVSNDILLPNWFGNNDFHAAHRSNLLRKNIAYYKKFGWTEPDNLAYVWPV